MSWIVFYWMHLFADIVKIIHFSLNYEGIWNDGKVLIIYRGQSWVVKEAISCSWQDLNPGCYYVPVPLNSGNIFSRPSVPDLVHQKLHNFGYSVFVNTSHKPNPYWSVSSVMNEIDGTYLLCFCNQGWHCVATPVAAYSKALIQEFTSIWKTSGVSQQLQCSP
jgi:hypothetical protein